MNNPYQLRQSTSRAFFSKVILCIGMVILLTRLADLQIIKGAYYRNLSEGNRLRSVTIRAPRGKIYARGGEVLSTNKEVKKNVLFDPKNAYVKEVATDNMGGEDLITEWVREYPLNNITAHLVGYLGEVSNDEVGKPDPHCVEKGMKDSGSLTGRGGLEQQYDCELRGIDGKELVEVDIQGNRVRAMGRKLPIPGSDITTTIDYGLQKVLSESFQDLRGAAVATDSHGQVLAMYSNPSFDPSAFLVHNPTNDATVRDLFNDPSLPLFNRAISGSYHPGSIFKIITSSAALEEKTITADFKYTDTGNLSVNGFNYSTWYFSQYGGTEGEINLVRAIARSTDTFFYKVGELVGIDNLVRWADNYGVGKQTGINLPGETAGLLPSPAWKQKVLAEKWFLGNTYHFSIGQGDLLTTPIQANVITTVIANGGYLCAPSLTFQRQPNCTKVPLAPQTIATIKEGMIQACSPGGTAFPFFDFLIDKNLPAGQQVACKTGTAETGEKSPTHAWFTIMAPATNPEIVLTVLVEKGGEGSKVAAPIARQALDYWFHVRTP